MACIPNEADKFCFIVLMALVLAGERNGSLKPTLVDHKVSQIIKRKFLNVFQAISVVYELLTCGKKMENMSLWSAEFQRSIHNHFAWPLRWLVKALFNGRFLSSNIFISLADKINNFDVGELESRAKSQRIAILKMELIIS